MLGLDFILTHLNQLEEHAMFSGLCGWQSTSRIEIPNTILRFRRNNLNWRMWAADVAVLWVLWRFCGWVCKSFVTHRWPHWVSHSEHFMDALVKTLKSHGNFSWCTMNEMRTDEIPTKHYPGVCFRCVLVLLGVSLFWMWDGVCFAIWHPRCPSEKFNWRNFQRYVICLTYLQGCCYCCVSVIKMYAGKRMMNCGRLM